MWKNFENYNNTSGFFGGQIWRLNKREQLSVEIFEKKVLRMIYGGKKANDV